MKKVLLGCFMLLTGCMGTAVILAGSMACDWTWNNQLSAMQNISHYGLMPAVTIFICIGIVGLALAIWGILDKRN